MLEVTEQGRMGSKLKMVAPNHIKHKPVGCNASPLIKKCESIPTLNVADVDYEEDEEGEGCGTSGVPTPMPPFLLDSVELVKTVPPADFLPCR